MPRAQVRDVELHYEIGGDGRPVLFIGGTGGDLRQRPNIFDGPLASCHTVLAYDQRGLGQSSKPDEPCTMADYADDAAALLAHVGWDEVAVVGVSFGGMVAQELVLRHPGPVARLVLCCTSSGGEGRASYPLHELGSLAEEERLAVQLGLSDTRYGETWQREHPEEAAAMFAAMRARANVGERDDAAAVGARRQLEARAGHDTWDRLDRIDVPTLVCAGRHDGIAPVSNSEALASRIPDATLQVFDGGHLFLLQDRRAWATILEFLG